MQPTDDQEMDDSSSLSSPPDSLAKYGEDPGLGEIVVQLTRGNKEEDDGKFLKTDGKDVAEDDSHISPGVPDEQQDQEQQQQPPSTATQETETARTSPSSEKKRDHSSALVSKSIPTMPPKKAKAKKSKWAPDTVVQDPKSPLTKVDLRAILSHPKAWNVLTEEEQAEILGHFPDERWIVADPADPDGRRKMPNVGALRNDDNFRHDLARFCEGIREGKHDPDWLYEAWTARELRLAGVFDDFVADRFEQQWDVQIPEGLRPPHSGGQGPGTEVGGASAPEEEGEEGEEGFERELGRDGGEDAESGDGDGDVVMGGVQSQAELEGSTEGQPASSASSVVRGVDEMKVSPMTD